MPCLFLSISPLFSKEIRVLEMVGANIPVFEIRVFCRILPFAFFKTSIITRSFSLSSRSTLVSDILISLFSTICFAEDVSDEKYLYI